MVSLDKGVYAITLRKRRTEVNNHLVDHRHILRGTLTCAGLYHACEMFVAGIENGDRFGVDGDIVVVDAFFSLGAVSFVVFTIYRMSGKFYERADQKAVDTVTSLQRPDSCEVYL